MHARVFLDSALQKAEMGIDLTSEMTDGNSKCEWPRRCVHQTNGREGSRGKNKRLLFREITQCASTMVSEGGTAALKD
jgi:hypothetical protein